jgi:hypothetical protein
MSRKDLVSLLIFEAQTLGQAMFCTTQPDFWLRRLEVAIPDDVDVIVEAAGSLEYIHLFGGRS